MRQVAGLILKTLADVDNKKVLDEVREEVAGITCRFPVPGLD